MNGVIYLTDSGSNTYASYQVSSGATNSVELAGVTLGSLSLYDNIVGVTTADFQNETHGVTIDVASITSRAADGWTHITTLIGSNYGDTLIGDSRNLTITGGSGNNLIEGGGGADTLDGGIGGVNTISYSWASSGITVNLAAGTDSTGSTLRHFSNVVGSAYNDTITGISGSTLTGGGGYDTYDYSIAGGVQTIVNGVNTAPFAQGELDIGAGITAGNLWFEQQGSNLVIQVLGNSSDQLTIQGWFANAYSQLESIVLSDGSRISNAEVSTLTTAMTDYQSANSSFNPQGSSAAMPAAVAATLPNYWVAGQPGLTVQAAAGSAGSAIALSIATAPNVLDLGASLAITISSLPKGTSLSSGTQNSDGSWTLTPSQLSGLTMTVPAGSFAGTANLVVTSTATDSNGVRVSRVADLAVSIAGTATAPTLSVQSASGQAGSAIALNIASALTATDGTESLSVKIAGLPSGATLSAGTRNADGSWTLTPTQLSGITLTAPAGSFSGTASLAVTATATETDGSTASTSASLPVTIAGTATAPTLSVQNASGNAGSTIALNIASALTAADGTESLSVRIVGLPKGLTLSEGIQNTDGSWTLTPAQLSGLSMVVPAGSFAGTTHLTVTSTATESDGSAASVSAVASVSIAGVASAPTLSVTPISRDDGTTIPLAISSALTATDGQETLSIRIAGLPTGASLSAGTQNADGSWTLTPAQLSGLNLIVPADSLVGTADVSVIATAVETDGSSASTSATLPVTLLGTAPSLSVQSASGNSGSAISLSITTALVNSFPGAALGTMNASLLTQGDVENNNTTDLVWRASNAETTVWALNSSGAITANSLGLIGTSWVILGSGNYLGGTATQMLTDSTSDGTMTLWWVNNGILSGINLGQHWQNISYVGSGYYLGNGQDDILVKNNTDNHMYVWWVNATTDTLTGWDLGAYWGNIQFIANGTFYHGGETNMLVKNLGDGHMYDWWVDPASHTLQGIDLGAYLTVNQVIATGNFLGNGSDDMLIQNTSDNHMYVWWIDGSGTLQGIDLGAYWASNIHYLASGHFAGTGDEMLVQNTTDNHVYMWWVDTSTNALTGRDLGAMPANWQIVATGDYNGDGYTDVVWQNSATGQVQLWQMGNTSLPGNTAALSVTIAGLPNNAILSSGTKNSDGTWTLTQAQLAALTVTVPPGSPSGTVNLTVTSAAMEPGGQTLSTTVTLPLTVSGLAQVGNNYYLYAGNGSGPELKYNGVAVVAGGNGGWTPIGAAETATGYDVAWDVPGENYYSVWTTDSNGNYTGLAVANVSGTNLTLETLELTFNQDLNGDGIVGVPAIQTDTNSYGTTSLVEAGNNYYLYGGSGSGPELKYNGVAVVAGGNGGWTAIGAAETATGYDVAWDVPGENYYSVWTTDSNGNYTGLAVANVSGTNLTLETLELTFNQDLNGDGAVGLTVAAGASLELTGADTASVRFLGATGTLIVDHSSTFSGQVVGFTGNGNMLSSDLLDLKDIVPGSATDSYTGSTTSGTLTVTDGQGHTANIPLVGNYLNSTFYLSSDGNGGTLVVDPPKTADQPPSFGNVPSQNGTTTLTASSDGATLTTGSGDYRLADAGTGGVYEFIPGGGTVVIDNGGSDKTCPNNQLDFGGDITDEQLWFQQTGNDLQINVLGTSSKISISNWFAGDTGAQLQSFTSDGLKLDTKTAQLVSAMTTYAVNNPAFNPAQVTQIPTDANLQNALAAAWHH